MKYLLIITFAFFVSSQINAQGGAAINTTGNSADPSAMLDISGVSKGVLINRMTTNERNAIITPAEGLFIFNISNKCFEYFAYGIWQTMSCATCPLPDDAGAINGSTAVCQGQTGVSYNINSITNATSYIWAYSGTGVTINGTSNSITINFAANATSGILTVKGNNQCGNGAASPDFNITINAVPSAPAAGTNSPTQTEIIWSWNAVAGATGYKYNTTNDYLSATDNGANTSYTQTGLACNTSYTLYVWAYNNCGISAIVNLNETTLPSFIYCGGGPITFTYKGSSVTYGTVSGQNSTCWLERNLGALQVATAYNDANSYGDLFQWGRLADGHQIRSSNTTSSQSSITNPGHSKFIISSADNWYCGSNPDNLWQGVSGINNPCPTGWRLPTSTELNNERISWSTNDYIGAINSPLKLPLAGFRDHYYLYNGIISDIGSYGYYWSSTVSGVYSLYLNFYNGNANIYNYNRADGFSIRCIKD